MSDAADKAVPCLNCGYDVAGMNPAGVCPECAQPVLASVHAGDLVYSSPMQVEWLQQGVWTLRWSVGLAGAGLVSVGTSDLLRQWFTELVEDLLSVLGVSAVVFSVVLWVVGLWMISAPEPQNEWRESQWSSRRWTRYATGCVVAFFLLAIALSPWTGGSLLLLVPAFMPFVVSVAVQLFASIAMLTRLAERAGEEKNHPLPMAMYILAFLFIGLVWFAHAFVTIPLMVVYFVALVRLTRRLKAVQERQPAMAAEKAGTVA